ncbi:MAG: hypothetical protein Q4B29_01965 [Candidatus Saccharibacteria bacterium]|nr:hypothetical protein [Candidatus Saccharibacteria bacterium]
MIYAKIDPSLYGDFQAACQGANKRWKLMSVNIEAGGLLRLEFADLKTQDSYGVCRSEVIDFKAYRCDFTVRSRFGIGGNISWRVRLFEPKTEPLPGKTEAWQICDIAQSESGEKKSHALLYSQWGYNFISSTGF